MGQCASIYCKSPILARLITDVNFCSTQAYTEANFVPPSVPASMQPGGIYNSPNMPLQRQDIEYGVREMSVASELSNTRQTAENNGSGVTQDAAGVLQVPSRWLTRISQVSLPRYRDVTSWVQDRSRRSDERNSEVPVGPYQKF